MDSRTALSGSAHTLPRLVLPKYADEDIFGLFVCFLHKSGFKYTLEILGQELALRKIASTSFEGISEEAVAQHTAFCLTQLAAERGGVKAPQLPRPAQHKANDAGTPDKDAHSPTLAQNDNIVEDMLREDDDLLEDSIAPLSAQENASGDPLREERGQHMRRRRVDNGSDSLSGEDKAEFEAALEGPVHQPHASGALMSSPRSPAGRRARRRAHVRSDGEEEKDRTAASIPSHPAAPDDHGDGDGDDTSPRDNSKRSPRHNFSPPTSRGEVEDAAVNRGSTGAGATNRDRPMNPQQQQHMSSSNHAINVRETSESHTPQRAALDSSQPLVADNISSYHGSGDGSRARTRPGRHHSSGGGDKAEAANDNVRKRSDSEGGGKRSVSGDAECAPTKRVAYQTHAGPPAQSTGDKGRDWDSLHGRSSSRSPQRQDRRKDGVLRGSARGTSPSDGPAWQPTREGTKSLGRYSRGGDAEAEQDERPHQRARYSR